MTFVRPDVQNLLAMLAAAPGPPMHEVDPVTARAMMRQMGLLTELPRGELAHVVDFTIPSPQGHAIPARAYSDVEAAGPGPVLVYYHGGGWVIGDLETHDALCAEIARTLAITVVSIDYRLAPEHPFPAAVDDCLAATRWLAETAMPVGHIVTGLIPGGRQRRWQPRRSGHAAAARQAAGADPCAVADLSRHRHDRAGRLDERVRRGPPAHL